MFSDNIKHSSSESPEMSGEIFCAYDAANDRSKNDSERKNLRITIKTPENKIRPREIDSTLSHGVKYIHVECKFCEIRLNVKCEV